MSSAEREKSYFGYLLGCGYALIVSQWLTNGSLGPSWLTEFANFGVYSTMGQMALWGNYFVMLLILGLFLGRKIAPIYKQRALIIVSTIAVMIGNVFVFLSGSGYIPTPLYLLGMSLIGLGNGALMLTFGEYYCHIGVREASITLSTCFILGSLLFLGVSAIGIYNVVTGLVVQLFLLPLIPISIFAAWHYQHKIKIDDEDSNPALTREAAANLADIDEPQSRTDTMKPVLPFFITVFVFGLILGLISGLWGAQELESKHYVWALGMIAMGTLLLIGSISSENFTLDQLSRTLVPLLVAAVLLLPALASNYVTVISILITAGYVYARVFYSIGYVAIAQTRSVPILPLVALSISAEAIGAVIGQFGSGILFKDIISLENLYIVISVAVAILVIVASFFLREKNVVTLWGLQKEETSEDIIDRRTMEYALKNGLTLRETDVAALLARGFTAEVIAQELSLSISTVRTHMRNIYAKSGVHSQPELMRVIAFDWDKSHS